MSRGHRGATDRPHRPTRRRVPDDGPLAGAPAHCGKHEDPERESCKSMDIVLIPSALMLGLRIRNLEEPAMDPITMRDEARTGLAEEESGDGQMMADEAPPLRTEVISPAPEPPGRRTTHRSRVRGRLLEMAESYEAANALHQAMELYFELVEEYRDTPEAIDAEDRLMDVARRYEQSGEPRVARGIYERMLNNDH